MRFGGTVFCFMELSNVAFWLVMIIWRCVRSRRGGGTALGPVEAASSSRAALGEGTEVLVMETLHDFHSVGDGTVINSGA